MLVLLCLVGYMFVYMFQSKYFLALIVKNINNKNKNYNQCWFYYVLSYIYSCIGYCIVGVISSGNKLVLIQDGVQR